MHICKLAKLLSSHIMPLNPFGLCIIRLALKFQADATATAVNAHLICMENMRRNAPLVSELDPEIGHGIDAKSALSRVSE